LKKDCYHGGKLKTTLFVLILLVVSGSAFPQDTLLSKPILTKKFDLTIDYIFISKYQTGQDGQQANEKTYEDFNIFIPITDTSFQIHSKTGIKNVLYRDIKEISFKGDNYKGNGIFFGVMGGLLTGLVTAALISSSSEHGHEGNAFVAFLSLPVLTIAGTVIGWSVGAHSYERETFDISKYTPHERKDRALKLFLKYKINL
jgi:hypothetical protein